MLGYSKEIVWCNFFIIIFKKFFLNDKLTINYLSENKIIIEKF